MELLDDNKLEIALVADYDTTCNILKLFPQFDTLNFWKSKCDKLYPEKTYFEFFTGPENFRLKERTFVITSEKCISRIFDDKLIEYYDSMVMTKVLSITTLKTKINIEKRFITIKLNDDINLYTFSQSDIRNECYDIIGKDYDLGHNNYDYFIIDISEFNLKNNIKAVKSEWITGYECAKLLYDKHNNKF